MSPGTYAETLRILTDDELKRRCADCLDLYHRERDKVREWGFCLAARDECRRRGNEQWWDEAVAADDARRAAGKRGGK